MNNIAVLKQSLTELKLIDRCDFVYNGQEAVNKARDILQSKYNSHKYWGGVKSIQPLCLVLTDFQMPKMNGIQAIEKIKSKVQALNSEREEGDFEVIEPVFVIQTAYYGPAFKKHSKNLEIQGVYEKPMRKERLLEIMQKVVAKY